MSRGQITCGLILDRQLFIDMSCWHRAVTRPRERYHGATHIAGPVEDSEAAFAERWQTELLARAWHALSDDETTSGAPYYTVLKCRTENPAASVSELTAAVNRQRSGSAPLTEADLRQILQRAQQQFAELLIVEIEQELAEVRLLP